MSFGPLTLNELTMAGSVEILGVTGTSLFTFDKKTGVIAYGASIENLDIQRMLGTMGINVNLGARAGLMGRRVWWGGGV